MAGKRVFNALAENSLLSNLDILSMTAPNTAVTKAVSAVVRDGQLSILFQPSLSDFPTIAGIEVNRLGAAPPMTAPVSPAPMTPVSSPTFDPVLINCGGISYTDKQGRMWSQDKHFQGGATYVNSADAIANSVDDTLYIRSVGR
jgi:hypothetical protein